MLVTPTFARFVFAIILAQVGSPLAIENAHRNLLDMEDDE